MGGAPSLCRPGRAHHQHLHRSVEGFNGLGGRVSWCNTQAEILTVPCKPFYGARGPSPPRMEAHPRARAYARHKASTFERGHLHVRTEDEEAFLQRFWTPSHRSARN